MKIAGIICEYNPFHNGHKYHIEQTRKLYGATHIICVMSGNFVQRGDVAVYDKWVRTETALVSGADLVIEIPVRFCLSSAEYFARAAVFLLDSLGCVDMISFGSECGDMELLDQTVQAVLYAEESDEFYSYIKNGNSYPSALSRAINHYYTNDILETLSEPNNILALEYIKALDNIGSFITPVTIPRRGARHDDDDLPVSSKDITESVPIASASYIRKLITNGQDPCEFVPSCLPAEFASIKQIENTILYKLRNMDTNRLSEISDMFNGLEYRIYKAARIAKNLNELLFMVKTKRFTMARIRRIILCAVLDITKKHLQTPPLYVKILGMNNRGREILSASDCKLPVGSSPAKFMRIGDAAKMMVKQEDNATNLYAMCYGENKPCGLEFTKKPIIV